MPTICLAVAYICAVLYFYAGALYIEEEISPHFHNTAKFWVLREFVFRSLVVVVLVFSIGYAGVVPSVPHEPYSKTALGILWGTQFLYLVWDCVVWQLGKGNQSIVTALRERFLPNDIFGVIAGAAIFIGLACPTPVITTSGVAPNQTISEGLPMWGVTIGTIGTFLYIVCVLGLVRKVEGGLKNFLCDSWVKVRDRKIR